MLSVSHQSSGPCRRISTSSESFAWYGITMNGRPLAVVPTCNRHDVRVPGQSAHRALLAHEAVEIVRVEVGGQYLDGDARSSIGWAHR